MRMIERLRTIDNITIPDQHQNHKSSFDFGHCLAAC